MMDEVLMILILGTIILAVCCVILATYFNRKSKRTNVWDSSTNPQSGINSAPISRKTSSSCLITLDKQLPQPRSRSASFGEDLTARLQILAAGSSYRSFAPAVPNQTLRTPKLSLGSARRSTLTNNILPVIPTKPTAPTISFQLRYEQTIETLFISIFQLNNYTTIKDNHNVYIILYLLPNDDEQRRTRSSVDGIFNDNFDFPLKPDELLNRTLRLTAYKVDSATRIRQIIGHLFIKFDQYIDENNVDKTFATNTLSEDLTNDLNTRTDYFGELLLTSSYVKIESVIQIRIQQINQLNIEQSKYKTPLHAHFSGQTSSSPNKYYWVTTPSFVIPSSSSFIIDQTLKLPAYSSLISENDSQIECHLRLHLDSSNQIHGHARWKHSLRSTSPHTYTVSLVAL